MAADLDPQPACVDQLRPIDPDGVDRRPPRRRQTDDQEAAHLPGKVLVPFLGVGVEEANCGAGLRIRGDDAVVLDPVSYTHLTLPTSDLV